MYLPFYSKKSIPSSSEISASSLEVCETSAPIICGLLTPVIIIITLIALGFGLVPNNITIGEQTSAPNLIFDILIWIIEIVVAIGIIQISLNLVDNKPAGISDLRTGYKLIIKYILTAILVSLIVVAGLMLLVIPGIIFAVRLQFAPYLVVDKGLGPVAAVRGSWEMTGGSARRILMLDLVMGLITALGAIVFGVGLLVAAPVSAIAAAFVYRKLRG